MSLKSEDIKIKCYNKEHLFSLDSDNVVNPVEIALTYLNAHK